MFIVLTQESVAIAWSEAVSLSQQQQEKTRELFECTLDIHNPILRSSQKLVSLATFLIHLCVMSAYYYATPITFFTLLERLEPSPGGLE